MTYGIGYQGSGDMHRMSTGMECYQAAAMQEQLLAAVIPMTWINVLSVSARCLSDNQHGWHERELCLGLKH